MNVFSSKYVHQDSENEENSGVNTEHQNLVKIKDKIKEKR